MDTLSPTDGTQAAAQMQGAVPAPDQQPSSGAAAPPPDAGVSGPPAAAPGAGGPQPQQQPAPAAAAAPPAQAAAPPAPPAPGGRSENWGATVYHGILDALGGANDVSVVPDPVTGQLRAQVAKSGPGTQWKRIISGAMAGLSAAGAAGNGPGAKTRALALGVGGGMQQEEAGEDKQIKQANNDYANAQQATVRRAQVALLTQNLSTNTFALERSKVDSNYLDSSHMNEFHKYVTDNGGEDLGVANSLADIIKMHNNDPNLIKQQAQGNIIGTPEISQEGKFTGMRYAMVPPNWDQQRISNDQKIPQVVPPKKPGDAPTVAWQTIPAGTMSNQRYATMYQAQIKAITDLEKQASDEKLKAAQATNQRAEAVKAGAEAGKASAEARAIPERVKIEQQNADTNAAKGVGTATRKDVATHDKQYVVPANGVEKSYQMSDLAYQEFEAAKKAGRSLPTGAQSMLQLSQHLSTTFGTVKGSRVTKDMIAEHLGARSVSDSAKVAVQRLTNGDQLSPAQWTAFHELIGQSRRVTWELATKEAKRKNIPIDFLPDDLSDLAGAMGHEFSVTDPNGGTHTFPDEDSANKYKAAAGIH